MLLQIMHQPVVSDQCGVRSTIPTWMQFWTQTTEMYLLMVLALETAALPMHSDMRMQLESCCRQVDIAKKR
ncbi:hypothetical protein RA27_22465 [Ruegeria sp. ANG-R]|nr:hypothetical protein RA27_22465 [Ruegeria sp. ANG-R]